MLRIIFGVFYRVYRHMPIDESGALQLDKRSVQFAARSAAKTTAQTALSGLSAKLIFWAGIAGTAIGAVIGTIIGFLICWTLTHTLHWI